MNNRMRIAIVTTSLFLSALTLSSVSGVEWNIQTVDSAGDVGWDSSIAVNNTGNPRISYGDYTRNGPHSVGDLKYASWSGSSWNISTVDIEWIQHTRVAVGIADTAHISYRDQYASLKYAVWNGANWTREVVDGWSVEGNSVFHNDLSLNTDGYPCISYQAHYDTQGAVDDLKYARFDGSSWDIERVDTPNDVGLFNSIVIDANDHPHISYYDQTNTALKYAVWNGSSWEIETVDNTGDIGWYSSIALDSSGRPCISYGDHSNGDLKYARWSGSSWVIQVVDSTGWVADFSSLALDSRDRPHISYYDTSHSDLKYAAWNGHSWVAETVDSTGDVGLYTSLALDTDDNVHISYYDATNKDLKYAFSPSSYCTMFVRSTFDCDLDGWTLVGSGDLTYIGQYGNPGGFVQYTDIPDSMHPGSGDGWIVAPAKFSGDWSCLDGQGVLSWDHVMLQVGGSPVILRGQVQISGPGGAGQCTTLKKMHTKWRSFSVPIDEAAWNVVSGSWLDLLANVTELKIRIEAVHNAGAPLDIDGIDNVLLSCERTLEPDFNHNGIVDMIDFVYFASKWLEAETWYNATGE